MFKHIVIFKFSEFAEGSSKEENTQLAKQQLEMLPNIIPQILGYEVGINSFNDPRAYDLVVVASFKSVEDFLVYRNHPDHAKVLEFIMKRVEDVKVVDYLLQ